MDTSELLTGSHRSRGRRLTKAGVAWLETQSASGRTIAECAAELGIHVDRLSRAIAADPKASEARRAGCHRAQLSPGALVVPPSQGRPVAISRAGLDTLRDLAAHGISKRSAAALLGMPKQTFLDCLTRQGEANAAWELGLAQVEQTCISRLIKLADDGSIASAIFLAKNMAGMSDTGPRDGGKVTTNVQIVLPGSMSREAYMAQFETSGETSDE